MVITRRNRAAPARRAERGQGLAEYALILALVAILAIGATQFLGGHISTALAGVGNQLSGLVSVEPAGPTPPPPSTYKNKKTCVAAGYKWVTSPKPNHCS